MRRNFAILTALAVCALLVPAAGAAAKASPAKTCTASSPNVIGKTVTGTLTSSNVDPSQARFATCAQAKKVMVKTTELRIEMPRVDQGLLLHADREVDRTRRRRLQVHLQRRRHGDLHQADFQVKYDQD